MPTIEGKNREPVSTHVRLLRPDDGGSLARVLVEPSPRAPIPESLKDFGQWMDCAFADARAGREWTFAIENAHHGLIGTTRVELRSSSPRIGILSYWIAPAFRHQGYGTAAARLTCELAWRYLRMSELRAFVLKSNVASRKVLANCGFHGRGIDTRIEREPVLRFTLASPPGKEKGMRIRSEQIESLRQEAAASTVERLAGEVRRDYPDRCEGFDDSEVLDYVYDAVSSAWDYGLHREHQVHAFVKLRFCVGHHFDEYGRFQEILNSEIDPDLKLDLLFHNASRADWRAAAHIGPQE